jgi:hypothetical protein
MTEIQGNHQEVREAARIYRVTPEILIPGIRPDDGYKPEVEFRPTQAKAAEELVRMLLGDEKFAAFCAPLKDTIVVDIGTGDNVESYRAAVLCEARGFVAVEPLVFEGTRAAFDKLERESQGRNRILYKPRIPYALVSQDGFGFLRRLPPRSVSVIMNGIDPIIIPSVAYRIALRESIQRVLANEGAFISYNCIGFKLGRGFVPKSLEGVLGVVRYTHRKD